MAKDGKTKIRNKARMSILTTSIQHFTGSLRAVRKEKITEHKDLKGKNKTITYR